MAPKRTYTRHNLSIAKPDALGPSDDKNIYHDASKRRKSTPPSPVNTMHHSHVMNSGGRPKGINWKTSTSKSTNSKSFSGPTSLPSDVDPFDSVLKMTQEKKMPQVSRGMSLYGGGRKSITSFSEDLKNSRRERNKREAPILLSDDSSSDGGIQLPTNDQPEAAHSGWDDIDTPIDSSSIFEPNLRGGSDFTAAEASARVFEGREYMSPRAAPPQRTFFGARIQEKSDQAQAWTTNQTNSPLLRLPASVRRSIFQHALGGNSIEFGFVTYLVDKTADGVKNYTPYFQYTSNVYPSTPFRGQCNPFHGTPLPLHGDPDTTGMTLLNGVCRQLYTETYMLPYALNDFYFNSGNALFNFIVKDNRLQPQQLKSIKSCVVLHQLPVPAVLEMLPNLQQVRLMAAEVPLEVGFYKVVRDGKAPKLVKFVPTAKCATGKLARPAIRGGGENDRNVDSRKAYGEKHSGYGSGRGCSGGDGEYGYSSGKDKKKQKSRWKH